MDLKEIMTAFAAESGIEDLAADENGAYHLGIDDMGVSFLEIPEGGRLATWAEVCDIPPEGRERLYQVMMEAMFMGSATGGAMFSVEPGGETIYLQRVDALSVMDLDGFKTMLERFVNVLEEWKKLVSDFRDIAPELDSIQRETEEETRQLGLGTGGFMQV